MSKLITSTKKQIKSKGDFVTRAPKVENFTDEPHNLENIYYLPIGRFQI